MMGLFPFFTEDEDEGLELEESAAPVVDDSLEPYREYEVDPETGRLTGRIVEGTAAIRSWVFFTLHSERYLHEIYSWDFGEEFSEMIGYSYDPDILQSEVKRCVEEALLVNEHILAVENLEAYQENDTLHITFSLETDQGDSGGSEVDLYV